MHSHLDQSLFTRFIRLGTPYVELNAQVDLDLDPHRRRSILHSSSIYVATKHLIYTFHTSHPYIVCDQGRARPSMAQLYNWRYRALGDLPYVHQSPEYISANPGLAFDYQFINVEDFMGRVRGVGCGFGESERSAEGASEGVNVVLWAG